MIRFCLWRQKHKTLKHCAPVVRMQRHDVTNVDGNRCAHYVSLLSPPDKERFTTDAKQRELLRLMRLPSRPCIECGLLTVGTTRCKRCEQAKQQRRNARRLHYKGDYAKRAAEVRANATVCWLCGAPARSGDPWTADHVNAGDPDSPLRAAHRSCNSRRGANHVA